MKPIQEIVRHAVFRIEALYDYAEHGSWRCAYRSRYGKCVCGLDDLCDRLGLPPVAVIDPEEKKSA